MNYQTLKVKELLRTKKGCAIIINDPKEGHGIVDIFQRGKGYSSMLYQSRIANPKNTNNDIFDQLGEGKAYWGESKNMKGIITEGFDFWLLKTPKNILSQDAYIAQSIAEGIRIMEELGKEYIIITP